MVSKVLKFTFVFAIVGLLNACALHKSMHQKVYDQFFDEETLTGQVVEVQDGQAVLYIATNNGAKAGMNFDAFQVQYDKSIAEAKAKYKLQRVGSIEIASSIDGHFANGKIVNGNVESYNLVQLRGK